jgi:hypothetical protein
MTKQKPAAFIATARKYLGYTSELLGRNAFGQRVGYDSAPWAGAFIDVVAREAGVRLPSFTYVPAGLAEAIRTGNISRTPRPGDIAIFNFASTGTDGMAASSFDMPAAGIVTDVRELRTNGRFITIEGNSTGPTSYQDKDGVHQRIRHLTDVIIFVRPEEFDGRVLARIAQLLTNLIKKLTGMSPGKLELDAIQEATDSKVELRTKNLKPGTRNRSIELLQLALSQVTDLQGAERGKLDAATTAAIARFQRNIGRVGPGAQGTLDLPTLQRLAKETGLFTVSE